LKLKAGECLFEGLGRPVALRNAGFGARKGPQSGEDDDLGGVFLAEEALVAIRASIDTL
jgi:hypothetical protein